MISSPRKIAFGFEATPFRNVNPKDRNIRMWQTVRMNFNNLFVLYNYPDISMLNPPRKAELDRYQKESPKTIVAPYMALGASTARSVEYRYFGDTWRLTPPPAGWDRIMPKRADLGSTGNPMNEHFLVCTCHDYMDYYMSKLLPVYQQLGLRGYYVDWADVRFCDNPSHGHGWTDWNGKRRATWNFRSVREFTRRVYTMMKSMDKDSLFFIHSSGTPCAPAHGFCDLFVSFYELTKVSAPVPFP